MVKKPLQLAAKNEKVAKLSQGLLTPKAAKDDSEINSDKSSQADSDLGNDLKAF